MSHICPHCEEEINRLINTDRGSDSVSDSEVELWLEGDCPKCEKPISAYSSAPLEADETPSESKLIEQAADKALKKVHSTGTTSVDSSVRQVVGELCHGHPWFDPDWDEAVETVLAQIDAQTPDEWQGELEYCSEDRAPYRLVDASPCPNCGQETIFNVTIEERAQMVQTPEGPHLPDDILGRGIVQVSCNACFDTVHKKEI